MVKGLAVALVAAAVLVPTATAQSHNTTLKLPLVPLSKTRLGAAAAGLHIAPGSGPVLRGHRGFVAGYGLDYGSIFLANTGLDSVNTSVDEYTTARRAQRALTYDKDDFHPGSGNFTELNLTYAGGPLTVPAIGNSHWAAIQGYSVLNYGSAYVVGEGFRDGRFVLDVEVAAGSQDLATSFATAKARALDERLHLALNGRLHGRPVPLPKLTKPGPPATGLDPVTAVLQTSDLPGSTIEHEGYGYPVLDGLFSGAFSEYDREFQPAGAFGRVSQSVIVMPSTNSGGFVAGYSPGWLVLSLSSFSGGTPTPVDVSSVGDEAQATIIPMSAPFVWASVAVVTLHSGRAADFVLAESSTTIDPSAVQTLAQAAANRLDAALGP
jgi:hypothetical protein